MAKVTRGIVLASASPRRGEILSRLGVPFRVRPAAVDESRLPNESAPSYVERLALAKAHAVYSGGSLAVLGSDTVVVVDGDVLGKPTHDANGRLMLSQLAGRTHEVHTAVAVVSDLGEFETRVVTEVDFREITAEQIAAYVATGEGRDKAGSYAIQGLGSGFVRAIRGSYDNVVGLPSAETLELLSEAGALVSWP